MTARAEVFTTAEELAQSIAAGEPVTLLDVRWRLDRPDGRNDYRAGHLPGAVYVDLENELSDHSATGRGRHPLPGGAALQRNLRAWGVRSGTPVVIYDDWNRAGSARAWWVLTAAGLHDVRILDGGLAAWQEAAGSLDTGQVTPDTGDITVTHDDLYTGARQVATAAELGDIAARGSLIDARAPERYRGENEPVDPVAGHIPGAINVPSTTLLDASGRFRPDAEVRAVFPGPGAGPPPVVYCGSGVTAAVAVAALAAAGREASLFPGSWSQWSADPSNPVEVGEAVEPGTAAQ
ncbi:sulfurtransferase [Nocardia speluncae]|uniref:Sulfurtransferase n=1 Tax=Nocardia speluncae TaxID=419477 RepID=A0A846XFP8_9NOCA|nr:sulfurtransferase [Nocardia speluncae]NKY33516.1 sulfurtransferase [Nocardia speluncae]